jgi:hypothetical protein
MPKRRLTPEQRERDRARKRVNRPHLKPGPKPKQGPWVEGRDYYCGGCMSRCVIPCPECLVGIAGCLACKGRGEVRCPVCEGGLSPVPPPDTMPQR